MTATPVRVLLLEQIHPDAEDLLRAAGFEVETEARALDEDELVARIADVNLLGIRSKTHVTQRVLDAAPVLAAVGAFCIGTNQIDLHAHVRARRSRSSTRRSRTPARSSNWRSPRSSRCAGGSPRRTP